MVDCEAVHKLSSLRGMLVNGAGDLRMLNYLLRCGFGSIALSWGFFNLSWDTMMVRMWETCLAFFEPTSRVSIDIIWPIVQ